MQRQNKALELNLEGFFFGLEQLDTSFNLRTNPVEQFLVCEMNNSSEQSRGAQGGNYETRQTGHRYRREYGWAFGG